MIHASARTPPGFGPPEPSSGIFARRAIASLTCYRRAIPPVPTADLNGRLRFFAQASSIHSIATQLIDNPALQPTTHVRPISADPGGSKPTALQCRRQDAEDTLRHERKNTVTDTGAHSAGACARAARAASRARCAACPLVDVSARLRRYTGARARGRSGGHRLFVYPV